MRNIPGRNGRAKNRRVLMNRLPWDAAHDMDAKLQPERVNTIRQGFEAVTSGGGRKRLGAGISRE